MEVEKKIDVIEERVNDRSLAYEILLELRQNCKRWFSAFMIVVVLWALTIAGFILYLNQYDYVATSTIEANGLYALADSSGNLIAQDVTPEQLQAFKDWWEINGIHKENNNQNKN